MVVPVLGTFAAIVIGMVIIASMWSHSDSLAQAAVRFEVRLAENQPAAGLITARVGNSDRTVYLHPDVVVTNGDIDRSSVIPGNTPGHFWVDVRLNAAGAEKMRQATMNHIGRPVAILIDGDVVALPTLKSPIGGAAVISGDFTGTDAERIANGMTTSQ
jgi:preprotein translocase subunit SecD